MAVRKLAFKQYTSFPSCTLVALAVGLFATGCGDDGGSSSAQDGPDASGPDGSATFDAGIPVPDAEGPDGALQTDPEAADYLQALPEFAAPEAPYDRAVGPANLEYGATQVCSSTPYSIRDASEADDVVMFNADPQVLWPGALIQGQSYQDGSLLLLPIAQRAPVGLSVTGLYASQTSATVENPTSSSVAQAVNGLLFDAVQDGTVPTNSILFTQTSAYSLSQAAIELGLSASYLGASVSGSLNVETDSSRTTVVAYALVRMFTVAVDQPPTPEDFFSGLTQEDLQEHVDLGRIGPNNLPVYVASVTYGQIMMFSATATASASEIQGALSASYNGFVGGGSASLTAAQRQVLETADIRVVTLGGNGAAVRSMIAGGNPADFFIGSDLISNAVPIAYTLKDLNGNVAKVAETSEYTLTTCTPNGFANFYVTNLNSATGYYGDGTQATLNTPIEGLTAPVGAAYDALDDLIFVLSASATAQTLRAYRPDGSLPEPPIEFAIPTLARGLTYDAQRGRLYAIGNFANADPQGTVILAYTPQGMPLGIPFVPSRQGNAYAAAYDPTREQLYVTFTPPSEGTQGQGFVVAFGFRGAEVPLTGGFAGLDLPEGIAYDATHDRLYVSDFRAGTIMMFDPEGNSVALDVPITGLSTPRGLHFDSVGNRLYVLESGASVISVFEPDGTPVTNLSVPSFPNLNRPYAIAFRP